MVPDDVPSVEVKELHRGRRYDPMTPQEAVRTCKDGVKIIIREGYYSWTHPIEVRKRVEVQGEKGTCSASFVVVLTAMSQECFFMDPGASTRIAGTGTLTTSPSSLLVGRACTSLEGSGTSPTVSFKDMAMDVV